MASELVDDDDDYLQVVLYEIATRFVLEGDTTHDNSIAEVSEEPSVGIPMIGQNDPTTPIGEAHSGIAIEMGTIEIEVPPAATEDVVDECDNNQLAEHSRLDAVANQPRLMLVSDNEVAEVTFNTTLQDHVTSPAEHHD